MRLTLYAKLLIAMMGVICCALSGHAQTAPDVPEVATHEIARRGPHVEQTGTIRSGLMAEALKPPPDDSAKWFLSLIYKPGDSQSEKLRQIVENSPAMRPWVDVRDPARSTMHYQLRSVLDQTQADWLENVRPKLTQDGVPCVIIQPPKNGHFGPSSTIVKLIHGVPSGANPTEQAEILSRKLRDGIVAYVKTIEQSPRAGIGVPPPFDARKPRDDVPPAEEPVEWPPLPTAPPSVPGPPQSPVPSTTATSLDWLTVALLIATGAAGTMGASKLAKWLADIAAFVREMKELRNRLPPNPPA